MVFELTEKALDAMRTQHEHEAVQHLRTASKYAESAAELRLAMDKVYNHRSHRTIST